MQFLLVGLLRIGEVQDHGWDRQDDEEQVEERDGGSAQPPVLAQDSRGLDGVVGEVELAHLRIC